MTRDVERQDGALKARMEQRLFDVRMTMQEVSDRTGTDYKQVRRWIKEGTRVPADFLAAFVGAVPVNARWLLTGEGDPEPPQGEEVEESFRRGAREVLDTMEEAVREVRMKYG
jgi:hypothetical protein